MKKAFLGWSVALAVLALGCGSEPTEGEDGGVTGAISADGDELVAQGAGGWEHQPVDFDCTTVVASKVRPGSARHFYSFPAQAGGKTTFALKGEWPASWGARILVADAKGKVLASRVVSWSNKVEVAVSFPASAKALVYVAPLQHGLVKKVYGYTLAASCASSTICAEYTTSDGRFYAKNFPAKALAEAQAWLKADPEVTEAGWSDGTCPASNAKPCPTTDPPVCGTPIVTDVTSTYESLCAFRKVVREAAGASGESKGKFTPGACAQLSCATALVTWEGSDSQTYYVQNVASKEEEQAFYASFPATAAFGSFEGACDQGWMCPALYKPVCGVIRDLPPQTFSNACAFSAAVRADAGGTAGQGSKGYIQGPGECGPVCDYSDPAKSYIVQDPELCKAVKFACESGKAPFFDACGCGCEAL
jgi:hypothetical protein